MTTLLPNREYSSLLIIDVQERLAPAMPAEVLAVVLRNTRILIETAKEFSLPVVVSEQYPKGLGPTLAEIREALPAQTQPREKIAFSCCAEAAFQPIFDPPTPRDWIVCGMEAHVCVLQTTLDLLQRGQRVFVVADAVCSRAKYNWRLGLDLMRQAGAVIGSAEIFAFALLGAAGSDSFKRISKLVR